VSAFQTDSGRGLDMPDFCSICRLLSATATLLCSAVPANEAFAPPSPTTISQPEAAALKERRGDEAGGCGGVANPC